ncbi:DNA polymerase family B-domain-containing protein [Rhizophagus irregularis DAOM 181602=DAOM 197198]|nr:DNA polymerase family B-domain-containing protein [Rhizophagus irregularis DAOM 181602=DAOM 197198]
MATDNEGSSQKINGKYCYVLRLYGSLINGQKAIVILLGIQVFFDVLVPDGETPDECEMKIRDILSGEVDTQKIEHIKAFPFRGYHTEKKTYLRIYMSGTGKRKTAIMAVQDNNYETASDDLYSFHRKVARENGIQLSGWSMLGNYMYKKRIDPLCPHTFYLSKKYFQPIKDLTTITDRFPISALRRDRTSLPQKALPRSEVEKEGSLKFFLQKCGLDAKVDMPYNKMWKTYSEAKKDPSPSTARKMREVAYYCIIDALRCQELLVKLSQINEYREVASIAYVSLFDSHYRANGMKVRNLLGAYAFKHDMLFSARIPEKVEKGKYPGAYVFPPKKGIETKRPVTGLDFRSLYPSLIMAYNLSPEKFIFNPEEAVIIKKNGNSLHEISFPFNKRTIQAWCVRHDNRSEKKGLYPTVLEELFAMRQELKAQLASLGKKKDQLGKIISSVKEKGKRIPEKLDLEYKSLCFEYDCLNSKQKAVKLFMNTFYGEAGNPLSSIFLRALAGGTTSAGKYNIKLVAEYVEKKGFGTKYGDTDSLYLTCPDKYFEKCDEAFSRKELSKEAYWTEMVKITMDVMKKLRDQINAYLRIKSGTSYLKMAYEEVLFPVCFTGKKKYFGVGHEDVVNFKPKTLFMKGIETVKQGKSQLLKFIGEKIMREAMDINNTRSIHDIVEATLREAQNKEWDFNDFIVMGTWKPKKKNLCNNRFMERMRERNKRIPDPGERFSYVVVKGPRLRNEKGRLIPVRVGDYMEYADIAKEKNMEIDINYYLGTTVGMCARFINEDDRYQPPASHKIMQLKDSDEKEKQTDKYSQDEAIKWLKKYIKDLQ